MGLLIIILALLFFGIPIYLLIRFRINIVDSVLALLLSISVLFFINGLSDNQQDYYQLADGVDTNYTPFSSAHIITLYTFLTLSIIALTMLWIKQRALPPLLLVITVSMIMIGAVLNVAIIMQVMAQPERDIFMLYLLPIAYLIIMSIVMVRLLLDEATISVYREYKYPLLNKLNNLMAKAQWQPLLLLLFMLPVFLLVMFILVIFGQDPRAISKVFTETTTWNFSTKTHPPLIDHRGHYLCTIAACGDAAIVKPIGWGSRHGYPIIVNRQLQVANAFEELIQDNLPKLHRVIRFFYDRYGYPLSKKITRSKQSNITYRLMKPLEFFFIIVLYLFCLNPEQKISKQYFVN